MRHFYPKMGGASSSQARNRKAKLLLQDVTNCTVLIPFSQNACRSEGSVDPLPAHMLGPKAKRTKNFTLRALVQHLSP